MSDTTFSAIAESLETLVRLVSIGLVDGKPQKEQIAMLSEAGMGPKKISEILDTTPNNVSVTLSGLRKAKKR